MDGNWDALVTRCQLLVGDSEKSQWMLAKLLGECESHLNQYTPPRTIEELADAVSISRSYAYDLLRIHRLLGAWFDRAAVKPSMAICRATVTYDEDRAEELMDEWAAQGCPKFRVWQQYLEQRTSDETASGDPLKVAISLLRKLHHVQLTADMAKSIPMRGLKPDQIDAIDRSCEFFVRVRARARAIKRSRIRAGAVSVNEDS